MDIREDNLFGGTGILFEPTKEKGNIDIDFDSNGLEEFKTRAQCLLTLESCYQQPRSQQLVGPLARKMPIAVLVI